MLIHHQSSSLIPLHTATILPKLELETMATTLATLREIRRAQRADGPAAMLGIGTANPANFVLQEEFPDYYFRVKNKEHLTDLKETFKKLCK